MCDQFKLAALKVKSVSRDRFPLEFRYFCFLTNNFGNVMRQFHSLPLWIKYQDRCGSQGFLSFYVPLSIQDVCDHFLSIISLFLIAQISCSTIHLLEIARQLMRCFTSAPLDLNLPCQYQILQALFPHYELQKFQLLHPDVKYK